MTAGSALRVPLLGAEAYMSPERLELERVAVLDDAWVPVAPVDTLAEPGAYATVQAGRTPLLVMRGQDGVLRAFVNMCRHRGMALLERCGSTGSAVVCPYHAWRFSTDGTLKVIPQRATQFAGVDPADWGLLPASVGTWDGLVLASAAEGRALRVLQGQVPPPRTGPALREVGAFAVEGAFNWKLLVERSGDVAAVLPDLLLLRRPEGLCSRVVVPVAPDRSRVEVRVWADPGPAADRLVATERAALEQCVAACEGAQRALVSGTPPARDPGNGLVAAFHDRLLSRTTGPRTPRPGTVETRVTEDAR